MDISEMFDSDFRTNIFSVDAKGTGFVRGNRMKFDNL